MIEAEVYVPPKTADEIDQENIEDLEVTLSALWAYYDAWKYNEKLKTVWKDIFFKFATRLSRENSLAERVVEEKADHPDIAREKAAKRYPLWEIEDTRVHPAKEGWYEIIIVENPEYKAFSHECNGRVFQRQVVAGSIYIDDERLKAEDLTLYKEVTFIPDEETIKGMLYESGVHQRELDERFEELLVHYPLSRQLRDLEELEPEQLAGLQEYIYEGKPVVKFPAPKKANDG